jgi:hypothetical protein
VLHFAYKTMADEKRRDSEPLEDVRQLLADYSVDAATSQEGPDFANVERIVRGFGRSLVTCRTCSGLTLHAMLSLPCVELRPEAPVIIAEGVR